MISGAEQMAGSAVTATPESVTAQKYETWYAAMAARSVRQARASAAHRASRSAAGRTGPPPVPTMRTRSAASSRHGAATAMRAQPTRRGPAAASRASRVIVAPVVPQEIEARHRSGGGRRALTGWY